MSSDNASQAAKPADKQAPSYAAAETACPTTRIVGVETEYGVLAEGPIPANAMQLSAYVVAAYRDTVAASPIRWDYEGEDPLSDARGWHIERASAHPSLLTDNPLRPAPSGDAAGTDISVRDAANSSRHPAAAPSCHPAAEGSQDPGSQPVPARQPALPDLAGILTESRARPTGPSFENPGAAATVLANAARLYVDHAHPEYSAAEVATPREAALWDKAGEVVMLKASRALAADTSKPCAGLYKNNTDGKGASYGTHENYLVDRAVPFADIIAWMTPFLVTRQIFTGSGRVGLGQRSERPGFQLSQRADFMENTVGLETTLNRPIINTRDEPHADSARWRRLHVIVGDATRMEVATYLRVGVTNCVLWALEQGKQSGQLDESDIAAFTLADPVESFHAVSRDLSLHQALDMADGSRKTAVDIQHGFLDVVRSLISQADLDDESADVISRWATILDALGSDTSFSVSDQVEWMAKFEIFDAMRRRFDTGWDDPRLAAADVQWTDIRPERSLFTKVEASGRVERLFTDDEIDHAATHAPESTRAYLRGELIRRFPHNVTGASWDAVVLDNPEDSTLTRISLPDPHRAHKREVGAILDRASRIGDVIRDLA